MKAILKSRELGRGFYMGQHFYPGSTFQPYYFTLITAKETTWYLSHMLTSGKIYASFWTGYPPSVQRSNAKFPSNFQSSIARTYIRDITFAEPIPMLAVHFPHDHF
jgi:hypothetical protein